MKNIPFVIWMLFYPCMSEITSLIKRWVYFKTNTDYPKYSDNVVLVANVLEFAIWFYVGFLLFER